MQRFGTLIGVLCLAFLFSSSIIAQGNPGAPARPHRPKIGIALSGGGARGLAHIGVIEWMEENRIPVDYVAGTSMGALVGSMYATGMTPEQMHRFIHDINWDEVLLNEPTYDQLSFRRKQDRRTYTVGIPLGIKHGITTRNGFNPGHGIGLLLDRIAFSYSTVNTFDELAIPFRCVTTDMLSGERVVLHNGSLATALRATMAIPGVFTPTEFNGHVYADGGLVDNIPTDVAKDMGAEIVIAVNAGTPLLTREDLQTLGGVLSQAVNVMTIEHDRQSMKAAKVGMTLDLGKFTNGDFYDADKIMRRGYESAAQFAADLKPYALSEEDWQKYLEARRARFREPGGRVAELVVEGTTSEHEKQHLEERLAEFEGKELDAAKLETTLTRITGEGRLDTLGYEGFTSSRGPGLRILAHDKTYGPPFVDFGINVEGSGTGQFDFSAGFRLTLMDARNHGGEWRNDVVLGSLTFLSSELYQPIGTSKFFIAPYGFFLKQARGFFDNNHRIADYRDRRAGAGFDVGIASGRRGELRMGYQFFNGGLGTLVGVPTLPGPDGNSSLVRAKFVFDGQDNPFIPSRGERFTVEVNHVFAAPGAPHSFNQMQFNSSTFFPVTTHGSVFTVVGFWTSINDQPGFFQFFSLGGPFRLSAYSRDQFLGNHFAYGALGYRRDVFRLPPLLGKRVFAFGSGEIGSAFQDYHRIPVHESFNLGAVAETFLGPVGVTASVNGAGGTKINFSIGRLF